jgi:hypothetical protein
MLGYIKYVYGLAAENPTWNFGYQHSVQTTVTTASALTPSFDNPNIVAELSERDRSASISSISSSISSTKNSLLVSFSAKNEKLMANLMAKASGSKNKQSAAVDDTDDMSQFTDDNDNNILLALEQDLDTASLLSVDTTSSSQIFSASMFANSENATTTTGMKTSSTCSALSTASSNGAFLAEQKILASQSFTSNVTISSGSNHSSNNRNVTSATQHSQTCQLTRPITIRLGNIDLYAQTLNENAVALIKLEHINIAHGRSNTSDEKGGKCSDSAAKSSSSSSSSSSEILIRFKKLADDFVSKNGLIELLLQDFKFDIDLATVNGLVELIDDASDNFILGNMDSSPKEMIPLDLYLRNCRFLLKDDPHSPIENNPKLIDITIEKLNVTKLPSNQIVLKEIRMGQSNATNKRLARSKSSSKSKSIFEELDSLIKFQNDFELDKRVGQIKSDKFASLVYMLRKAKEDYSTLRTKLEQDTTVFAEEKADLVMKLNLSSMENRELKRTIKSLTEPPESTSGDEALVVTSKKESAVDHFELERRQFECLLKQFEEENEALKLKLQKSEDHIQILNIERECLMKNINKIK